MDKNVLIVIDVQKDFVNGALGTKEAEEMFPRLLEKVKSFKGTILMTKDTHTENYMDTQEGKLLPVVHCVEGTDGWEFPVELNDIVKAKGIKVYNKPTFGSTELALDIKSAFENGEIESVELVGICTDICVVSNALLIKANAPELKVYVDPSCCAGVTPEKHSNALDVMSSCQIIVREA